MEEALQSPGRGRALRYDALAALVLALFLSLCWAINDWPQVGRLVLPDNDDMMRLAQVRDWIAGQGFNDWTQYRLAPPAGGLMHWSRINDVGPAAIILALRPWIGTHGAELAAVCLYPALLFAAYLFLSARIARRIGGSQAALVALVVAAIAYPANSLFLPGRIDHHALQIVLVLVAILALMRAPSPASGALAGAAVALSLGVGLETAPQMLAILAVLFALWAWRGRPQAAMLVGFGGVLAGITALLLAFARPTYWSESWCDAFTPASASGALVGGALFVVLGLGTRWLDSPAKRGAVGAMLGALCGAGLLLRFPGCLSGPYGPMSPEMRHLFMDNVLEARGLFAGGGVGFGIPSAGLMAVASLVAMWLLWREPARWMLLVPICGVLLLSDLVLVAQVRGAYIGSALCAPLLARLILAARARERWRLPALLGAWLASAGMVHLLLPERLSRLLTPSAYANHKVDRACNGGDTWQQIDRYPAGVVMAPMNRAAYVIGATHHASVAAGYHRNDASSRAMYAFFLGSPDRARAIARAWRVRYVVFCPIDFGELDVARAYPDSVAAHLLAGKLPGWMRPIPLRDTGLRFYRIP